MNKLEKILEEILEEIDDLLETYSKNPYLADVDVTDVCYGINQAKDIVQKHMSERTHENLLDKTIEMCQLLSQVNEKLDKTADSSGSGGWIPVEERLPEEKKTVLVQWEKYDRRSNVMLTHLDVMWLDDAEEGVFKTINGIPNGKVIAWRPLPEPYHPERSEE